MIPTVIDNQEHRLADVLNGLLDRCPGGPLDVATAYFAISGYRLVRARLHQVGALRLLIGSEPQSGADVGLRPERKDEYLRLLRGDLEAEPFTEETLRVVEDLIALLRTEKVRVRLFDKGFLHAKAYLFHHDRVGPNNWADQLQPYAAIVGSSNFTGPGLSSNRELTSASNSQWRQAAGSPTIRRIDSGNHPDERGHILGLFAPVANKQEVPGKDQIDVLISTDVLSEGHRGHLVRRARGGGKGGGADRG